MLLLLAWPGITQGNEELSTFHHVTRQTDISGVAIVAASRESVFTDTRVACDTFGGFATFLTFSATGFMFCPFRLFTIFPVIHTPQTPELKLAEGCVVLTSVLGEADPLVVLEAVLHTLLLVLILLILLVLMVLHGLHLISTNSVTTYTQYSPLPPVCESAAAVLPCCLVCCPRPGSVCSRVCSPDHGWLVE